MPQIGYYHSDKDLKAERTKYCLVQDDEGHYFVIPSDRRADWEDWLWVFYEEECSGKDHPEWVQEIDGPHKLDFYLT